MQMKTIMRYYLILIRIATVTRMEINKGENVKKLEHLYIVGENVKC